MAPKTVRKYKVWKRCAVYWRCQMEEAGRIFYKEFYLRPDSYDFRDTLKTATLADVEKMVELGQIYEVPFRKDDSNG